MPASEAGGSDGDELDKGDGWELVFFDEAAAVGGTVSFRNGPVSRARSRGTLRVRLREILQCD